jgi:RNA polymerase sigma factor (sigma-70 family)
MDDKDLIARCLAGDPIAGETLVRHFSDLVYRVIQRIFIHKQAPLVPDDLADLHNSVFLALFENNLRKLRQYRGDNGCRLSSWIAIVASRMALNHLRKAGHRRLGWRRRFVSFDEIPEFASGAVPALELMEKGERFEMIERGIGRLAQREQVVIRLHFQHDLPIPTIADIIHMNIQATHTIKHRALGKIRSFVEKQKKMANPCENNHLPVSYGCDAYRFTTDIMAPLCRNP